MSDSEVLRATKIDFEAFDQARNHLQEAQDGFETEIEKVVASLEACIEGEPVALKGFAKHVLIRTNGMQPSWNQVVIGNGNGNYGTWLDGQYSICGIETWNRKQHVRLALSGEEERRQYLVDITILQAPQS